MEKNIKSCRLIGDIETIIENCYKENVTLREHKHLVKELSELKCFHDFVKDRRKVLPLVVIDKIIPVPISNAFKAKKYRRGKM